MHEYLTQRLLGAYIPMQYDPSLICKCMIIITKVHALAERVYNLHSSILSYCRHYQSPPLCVVLSAAAVANCGLSGSKGQPHYSLHSY